MQSFIYAAIDEVKVLDHAYGTGTNLYGCFYQTTGPIVFVDFNQVQCVIGRIFDWGKWAIVDRSTSVAKQRYTIQYESSILDQNPYSLNRFKKCLEIHPFSIRNSHPCKHMKNIL